MIVRFVAVVNFTALACVVHYFAVDEHEQRTLVARRAADFHAPLPVASVSYERGLEPWELERMPR